MVSPRVRWSSSRSSEISSFRSPLNTLRSTPPLMPGTGGVEKDEFRVEAGIGLSLVAVYALVAPGPGQSTVAGITLAFLVGQLYLVARLALRLTFFGAQMRLYESRRFGAARSR